MVGMIRTAGRERSLQLLNTAKSSPELRRRIHSLRQLNELLLSWESPLFEELVPLILEFQNEPSSPVRKCVIELIGEVGAKHRQLLPDIVPHLITFLRDNTPAVSRQVVASGKTLFRRTLAYIAVQGFNPSGSGISLQVTWDWILKLKDAIYLMAFQPENNVQAAAVKFVEEVILLFTPAPDVLPMLPDQSDVDGKETRFNISWVRGGHPFLISADLALEASKKLGQLLDMLRAPSFKTLGSSVTLALIHSLAAIANKRPAFYGRILPVLLGLDPHELMEDALRFSAVRIALKTAFSSCLKCSHPGAVPWKDRLGLALESLNDDFLMKKGKSELEEFSSDHKLSKDNKMSPTKKRFPSEESDVNQTDNVLGKRIRLTPPGSPGQSRSTEKVINVKDSGPSSSGGHDTATAVQQLLAIYSAFISQGDASSKSMALLMPTSPTELLVDLVIANTENIPPYRPAPEGKECIGVNRVLDVVGNSKDFHKKPITSELSFRNVFEQIASCFGVELATASDGTVDCHTTQPELVTTRSDQVPLNASDASVPAISNDDTSQQKSDSNFQTDESSLEEVMPDIDPSQTTIPGLEGFPHVGETQESVQVSHVSGPDLSDPYLENCSIPGPEIVNNISSAASTSASHMDNNMARTALAGSCLVSSATSTLGAFSMPFLFSKGAPPIANLTSEEKDQVQEMVYARIVDAYKSLALTGASDVRLSLLASIGSEYPLEMDAWGLLLKHVQSDYLEHQGHELTLHVLYKLFVDAEQEDDFFRSTTASSAYDSFLMAVARTLLETLPASDKSLNKLLGEAPYVSKPAFDLLESLCCPQSSEMLEKEGQTGDRVTQGLSIVWNLILGRPPFRDACLNIALKSAVHHLEEVRMKAIRLVANRLYSIPSIQQSIQEYAMQKMLSVVNVAQTEEMDVQSSTMMDKDGQPGLPEASTSISEAQRCMSLYFALCTKKHSLLRKIFTVYKDAARNAKQAIHRQIPILIRTIGSSTELLSLIADLPEGSVKLLMLVLQTLTDRAIPSPDLMLTVKRLYESKLKDVSILIPVLSCMPKDEVLPIFSNLVNLPIEKFRVALDRLLQGTSTNGTVLSPSEILIAIHGIDPDRDGIPLKKVTDACTVCFELQSVFTQQVLAKVLNQLVEQIPLPLLFMRTVIQSVGVFPSLVDFVMDILSRLVNKQIWKFPKLWVGFLKCALQTQPQSFSILLQLPAAQLENALNRSPSLKAPLAAHANEPSIRVSLPRSTLVVLGLLASDLQTTSLAQSTQSTNDKGNVGEPAAKEMTQESVPGG